MTNYDIVIIGSGLGGLLCGSILSRHGFNICIIEQGKQIGGCLQNFRRKGHTFDTGVHYIGSFNEGEVLRRCFQYFGLLDTVQYKQLDPNGFDVISFPEDKQQYCYANGYGPFTEALTEQFPREKDAIKNYTEILKQVFNSFPLNDLKINTRSFNINNEYFTTSVKDFLQSITADRDLQNVLAGTNLLYAGISDKTPMYIHCLINHSYINGAYRVINGSGQIAEHLARSISGNGGTILTGQKVTGLHQDNSGAINGIMTDKNENFSAKHVISGIHPLETIRLLDPKKIRPAYRKRITEMDNTIAIFCLYVLFKNDRFRYLNHNHYLYSHDNVWTAETYGADKWPAGCFFSMQAHGHNDTFAETASIMSYMTFKNVKHWEHTAPGKRGNSYRQFKEERADRLLQLIEKKFPGFRSTIESFYTSTPLTYRDYTGTINGSIYGIFRDCNKPLQSHLTAKTKISNLFLTGQNINMHGVLGVTLSALMTCGELLGLEHLLSQINSN